jgi:cell division protein ZapA
MTTTLDIKIQGRDYRVACAPDEMSSLQAAADLLNDRMGQIAQSTRSSGERLAVMTALNLADELNRANQASCAAPPDVAPTSAAETLDGEALQRRIKTVEAQLDEVLAAQESVF